MRMMENNQITTFNVIYCKLHIIHYFKVLHLIGPIFFESDPLHDAINGIKIVGVLTRASIKKINSQDADLETHIKKSWASPNLTFLCFVFFHLL